MNPMLIIKYCFLAAALSKFAVHCFDITVMQYIYLNPKKHSSSLTEK